MVDVTISDVREPIYEKRGLVWHGSRRMRVNDMPYIAEVKAFTRVRVERKLSQAVWYHPLASTHLRLDDNGSR